MRGIKERDIRDERDMRERHEREMKGWDSPATKGGPNVRCGMIQTHEREETVEVGKLCEAEMGRISMQTSQKGFLTSVFSVNAGVREGGH